METVKSDKTSERKEKKQKSKITAKSRYNQETNRTDFSKAYNSQDPEFTKDFRTALSKVVSKMSEDPDHPSNKIFKLLVSDNEKVNHEVSKVKVLLTNLNLLNL